MVSRQGNGAMKTGRSMPVAKSAGIDLIKYHTYDAYINGATAFIKYPVILTFIGSFRIVSLVTILHTDSVFWKSSSISGIQSV